MHASLHVLDLHHISITNVWLVFTKPHKYLTGKTATILLAFFSRMLKVAHVFTT